MKRVALTLFARAGVVLAAAICSGSLRAQPSVKGQWTGVMNWPIEAIHGAMLPTGKVLVLQSWRESMRLWDPMTEQFSNPTYPLPVAGPNDNPPSANFFCSGHTWLPDGRLMFVGGHIANDVGLRYANIYDPFTNTWANNVPDMNAGRWYPSATTLGTGEVLTLSGNRTGPGTVNRVPQIYNPETNTWRSLTEAQKSLPLYPRTFLAPDGNVVSLSSGWASITEFLDTGTGRWLPYTTATPDRDLANYGPAVMYDGGKVAYIGGGHNPTANISLLDLNESNPTWTIATQMAQPRRQNDATILADGTVFISGGSSIEHWNHPDGHIPMPEIWDPVTQQVTQMAAASDVYRGYHSIALLLPDGRVLVAGGDHDHAGSGPHSSNRNAEIYSPPYLFNDDGLPAERPTVTAAPESARLGSKFFVETPDAASIANALMIVPGSVTHAQDWAQRANHLEFAALDGGIDITLPSNPNLAPPGYYMLFLVNDDGVPSVADWLRVELPVEVPPLPGDFNGDGIVDAADYTTWREGLGTDYDHADYDEWKNNFGATANGLGIGAGTNVNLSNSTAVPEPTSFIMMIVASIIGVAVRRR